MGKNWQFGQDNQFFAKKKHHKIAYFGVHESGLPDFRRPWTANGWHQVNFKPTPENLGVKRFKLAMWEVGDIKIERTRARNIFYVCTRKLAKKWFFLVKRSVPKNFQWENFSGQVPTESLRTQDSENVYERWVQQIFDPVLPARSWEMPVKCELPAKIGRCSPKPYGHNFQISALKLNQRYFVYIKIPLIQFQGWNMKIVAVRFFVTPF